MTANDIWPAERARLIAMMDEYLAVLTRQQPAPLKLAPHLKNTENTRAIAVGSGLWRTIRSMRPGGHYFVDVHAGQVEYWGAIDEMGADAIYGVRLKIEAKLIAEIETLVVRGSGTYFVPDVVVAASDSFHAVIPEAERVSRRELIRVVHLYFDAIEQSDGDRLPVEGDCKRLVNGAEDTIMDVSGLPESEAHRALTVSEQMTRGDYAYIEQLRGRRFPIIDEARGLVMCHVLFDHPGDLKRYDGEIPFTTPNTMLAYEVFKVRNGLLDEVWAIGGALPYGIDSGWGPGSSGLA